LPIDLILGVKERSPFVIALHFKGFYFLLAGEFVFETQGAGRRAASLFYLAV
jgi:hypothetical protein